MDVVAVDWDVVDACVAVTAELTAVVCVDDESAKILYRMMCIKETTSIFLLFIKAEKRNYCSTKNDNTLKIFWEAACFVISDINPYLGALYREPYVNFWDIPHHPQECLI